MSKSKFGTTPTSVLLMLILFFPVGLYLMWKNTVFSKTTRFLISGVFILIFIGGLSNSGGNTNSGVLLQELTNGSFNDGPTFKSDGTFHWYVNDGPQISGNYQIGNLNSWENEEGTVGIRHLLWIVTFSDVKGSDYWDEDNSMTLRYDWNHPSVGGVLELNGNSIYYPISFTKTVDGDKLVSEYWSK